MSYVSWWNADNLHGPVQPPQKIKSRTHPLLELLIKLCPDDGLSVVDWRIPGWVDTGEPSALWHPADRELWEETQRFVNDMADFDFHEGWRYGFHAVLVEFEWTKTSYEYEEWDCHTNVYAHVELQANWRQLLLEHRVDPKELRRQLQEEENQRWAIYDDDDDYSPPRGTSQMRLPFEDWPPRLFFAPRRLSWQDVPSPASRPGSSAMVTPASVEPESSPVG